MTNLTIHLIFFAANTGSGNSSEPLISEQFLNITNSLTTIPVNILSLSSTLFIITRFLMSRIGKLNHQSQNYHELIEKFEYRDKVSAINHKNSYLFNRITNKSASVDQIDIMLNCADPYKALLLYSKAPGYMEFYPSGMPKLSVFAKCTKYYIFTQIFLISIAVFLFFRAFLIIFILYSRIKN